MAQPRYQVIERIDAGGMAEVFKANSTSLQGFQKLVAIKRILPTLTQNQHFVRMFLDEAKVSLHLNHTNTVQVFDLGIADGTYFIVMEFVDGTNLKNIIDYLQRQKQAMPVEQAVFIAIEICKGLTHAHDKLDQAGKPLSIVHRDISPPNVLISRAGEIKITDFGLAKAKSQAEQTDPGVVKGKFGYLSPEAAFGEEVDARTDIFAVGILLWEMLAGRRLFLGESDYDTLQLVRAAQIPPLGRMRSDVPPELERVLSRGLSKDIDARYQTSADFARDLARFLFRYGQVVTNYDIAEMIREVLDRIPRPQRTARDTAVDQAVQQELNRIVSLEQIDDLDRFLTQHYDSLPDQGEQSASALDGDFEDPRMWEELGFGVEGDTGSFAPLPDKGERGAENSPWQTAQLADLRRSAELSQELHIGNYQDTPTSGTPAASTPSPVAVDHGVAVVSPIMISSNGPVASPPAAGLSFARSEQWDDEDDEPATGPIAAPVVAFAREQADEPIVEARAPRQAQPTPVPERQTEPSQGSALKDPQVRKVLIVAVLGVLLVAMLAMAFVVFMR
jgi:eukaryotic-like serine/threonine-protein kinase